MKEKSRSYYVAKNSVYGALNKIIIMLLVFSSRTVFIQTLGAEYLGVNGLYSNILSMLSLAELGVGNVLIYSLYKHIANNDTDTISRLLSYYKKLYRKIAIFVLAFGILLVPFLKWIVNASFTSQDIVIFYLFYLINAALSYLVVYKSTLIRANQKQYIIESISTITKIIITIIQIIVLLAYKNFIAYLLVMLAGTIIQNILINFAANKNYKFIKAEGKLTREEKNSIFTNIKSTFIYKIGQLVINYTDNILISVLLSTIFVGYYSNYSMIVMQITGLVAIITTSMIASIGNLTTENNVEEKSLKIFYELLLFFHVLSAFCFICFITIFNNFITIWIGEQNLLSQSTVFAIAFNFYVQNIINPVWMYREAFGLFKQIKYLMLVTAFLNIILSIILGLRFGIAGIIFATGLARVLTTVWYEPLVLHKKVFNKPVFVYYMTQLKLIICTLLSLGISYSLTKNMESNVVTLLLKIILNLFIVVAIFGLVTHRTDAFKSWITRLRNFVK